MEETIRENKSAINEIYDMLDTKITQSLFCWIIGGICGVSLGVASMLYSQGADIKDSVASIDKRLAIVETKISK